MMNRNVNTILLNGSRRLIEFAAGEKIQPGTFLTFSSEGAAAEKRTLTNSVSGEAVELSFEDRGVANYADSNPGFAAIAYENTLTGQSPDGPKAMYQPNEGVMIIMPEKGATVNLRAIAGTYKRGNLLYVTANGRVTATAPADATAVAVAEEDFTVEATLATKSATDAGLSKFEYGSDLIAATLLV